MSTNLKHFIKTNLSPLRARVRSAANRIYEAVPEMVLGDTRVHEVYFIDDSGNYEAFSGASWATLSVKVGQQGSTAAFSAPTCYAITNGWTCALAVTGAVTACFVEFSVAVTAGVQTYAQLPVNVVDQIG